VACPCNPSHLGGRDWEDHGLRPGEKVTKTPISVSTLGMVVCACDPINLGGQSQPQTKTGDPT
jgi:hypothetical protein